jgi:hypothetical protein
MRRRDEVAFPFRERNVGRVDFQAGTTPGTQAKEALSLRKRLFAEQVSATEMGDGANAR